MDTAIVIAIVAAAIGAITALGVFLGPRLAERSRSRREVRRTHLEWIKVEVLQPILRQLIDYCIPVLDREKTNLEVLNGTEFMENVPVTDDARRWVHRINIVELGTRLNEELYADVKQNHFIELVGRWESFERSFGKMSSGG